MPSRPAALITGATGFVGHHLAAALLRQGRAVHLVVRAASRLERLNDLLGQPIVHVHDGTTDGLIRIVRAAAPQTVFHLASLFVAEHRPSDVEPLVHDNLLFGTQLLEAIAANGVPWLINTGTSWQHYEQLGERAVCLYAATKQAFESIVRFYIDTTPLRALTLKLFDTYGPGDPRGKLFALLRRAAGGGAALAMSPGEQQLDLVYIDDVVEAFLQAERLLHDRTPDLAFSYAVSSGTHLPLRDVAALYAEVTGQRLGIEWGGRQYRAREVMTPWHGEKLPGWQAQVSLADGIRRMEGLQ
jgi:nucleoside-diphosphate-sugar epimerase